MKMLAFLSVMALLAIGVASPASSQDTDPAKACKAGSTSGKCLLQLIATLQGQVMSLQGQVTSLQTALTEVQSNHALELGPYVSVDSGVENGLAGPNLIFKGSNVHIESGSGNTLDSTGLGNLVVGYDEDSVSPSTIDANRSGSRNLIVGPQHEFTASGGVVFGYKNSTTFKYATVTGGQFNESTSLASSVCGGAGNTASSNAASVSGGYYNIASGLYSTVSGGDYNTANGVTYASVVGGEQNVASGSSATVSGGSSNVASGWYASILGGDGVTVSSTFGHSP